MDHPVYQGSPYKKTLILVGVYMKAKDIYTLTWCESDNSVSGLQYDVAIYWLLGAAQLVSNRWLRNKSRYDSILNT